MSYTYLLNLYKEIEERLHQIDLLAEISPYEQGRRDLLNEFRVYLIDNMNSKLPKRIRKLLTEQKIFFIH